MLKNIFVIVSVCLMVTSCASTNQIRADNRNKLLSLSAGMSKIDVLKTMGTKTQTSSDGTVITNPYRTEMYRSNDKTFELMLYYTDTKKSDGAITDDELTPLVIIDGKLDGWGWSYWDMVILK